MTDLSADLLPDDTQQPTTDFPPAFVEALDTARGAMVLAIVQTNEPLQWLKAIKSAAKAMALSTRHGGVHWRDCFDLLYEPVANRPEVIAELGENTIATAIENGLHDFSELEGLNGHAADFDAPPPAESPAEYGVSSATIEQPAGPPPPLTIEEWLGRDLPPPDFILGDWLSTTSRALLVAPTGLGKTLKALALAMHVAAGRDFLHWRAHRPCCVLYIDGEMSRRLLRQRIADEVVRLGEKPTGYHALSHEDIEGFAPLNTPAGQACIERIIKQIGKPDLIVFDSIMCLTIGDMKDGEPWAQVMPWVRSLTKRNIGQLWIHHTGHDETRSYGDKTKEWQLDTVMHMERVARDDTDVSFNLEFRKARERTPQTRADFQTTRIALVGDQWVSEATAGVRAGHVSPLGLKFLNALHNALASDGARPRNGYRTTPFENWRAECARMGLIDTDPDKRKTASALFSKYRLELIGANRVVCDTEFAWLVK